MRLVYESFEIIIKIKISTETPRKQDTPNSVVVANVVHGDVGDNALCNPETLVSRVEGEFKDPEKLNIVITLRPAACSRDKIDSIRYSRAQIRILHDQEQTHICSGQVCKTTDTCACVCVWDGWLCTHVFVGLLLARPSFTFRVLLSASTASNYDSVSAYGSTCANTEETCARARTQHTHKHTHIHKHTYIYIYTEVETGYRRRY